MKNPYIYLNLLYLLSTALSANTINVPADQPKIQTAINMASNGDTILVSPGIYYENVNFNNKSVVLTSYYLFNSDTSFISNTIINGSQPAHPDTASCILILNGQDSTTIVQGFTITGGQGTSWKDEHSGGIYREGGGIIVALSSPTIRYNLIVNNEAVNNSGLAGTGGGGIRCGDGSPKILNNVIINNTGRYGAGIVLNWCDAVIRNNIIAGNIGGDEYGGGGIWINNTNGKTNIIENNTIVNNHSHKTGGGILMYNGDAKATLKNNIIYGNTAVASPQITAGSKVLVSYCNIDGNWAGVGNITNLPNFKDTVFYLSNISPDIDAGDTNKSYNDLNDEINTDNALFPSEGLLRNDIGAYGGPGAGIFPFFKFSGIGLMSASVNLGNSNIFDQLVKHKILIFNQSTDTRKIDSAIVMLHKDQLKLTYITTQNLKPSQSDSLIVEWTPSEEQQISDTILIYHNALNVKNPLKISVKGDVKKTGNVINIESESKIYNSPNPFSNITMITYSLCEGETSADLMVYDMAGKIVKSYLSINKLGSFEFDGSNLPEGIYINKLITADNKVMVNKMEIQR